MWEAEVGRFLAGGGGNDGGDAARPLVDPPFSIRLFRTVNRRRICQACGGTGGGNVDVGDQDDGRRGKYERMPYLGGVGGGG